MRDFSALGGFQTLRQRFLAAFRMLVHHTHLPLASRVDEIKATYSAIDGMVDLAIDDGVIDSAAARELFMARRARFAGECAVYFLRRDVAKATLKYDFEATRRMITGITL